MPKHLSPEVILALKGVRFIAQHMKDEDKTKEVSDLSFIMSNIFLHYYNSRARLSSAFYTTK